MAKSEVAHRYAKAFNELASETQTQQPLLAELREIEKALQNDKDIVDFFTSPVVSPSIKKKALADALAGKQISKESSSLIQLLAERNRFSAFSNIVESLEELLDEANGVTRGSVRSATVLAPDERKRIEEKVCKVTGKKVILTYKEDAALLGGLIAEVGSFTFDDSLESHLKRLSESLNRREN